MAHAHTGISSTNMEEVLCGTWAIEKVWVEERRDVTIEGIKFTLDKNGDVFWTHDSEKQPTIPLFSLESYEIFTVHTGTSFYIRFGAYEGHIIEFKVMPPLPGDKLLLEGWCSLQCSRIIEQPDYNPVEEFSFLSAVEEGYFSDMVIESQENKSFHVHSSILGLLGTDMCWLSDPPPLSGLPEGVLGCILHWLYAECLPTAMTEDLALQVIDTIKEYPCMKPLITTCQIYLKNMALRNQIVELVNDIHMCANQIIKYVSVPGEHLGCHPDKLCLVLKQCLRETAVALVKLLLLCDLYIKNKNELITEEKNEIIKYTRSRLPNFVSQLRRLLEQLKAIFSSMNSVQKREFATYLVPEVEDIMDIISTLFFDIKNALEQIMHTTSGKNISPSELKKPTTNEEILSNELHDDLRDRDMAKLQYLHQQCTYALMFFFHNKENFSEMNEARRTHTILPKVEMLIADLTIFLSRLEEVSAAIDNRLKWRGFKFCFKIVTSKVHNVISKLVQHQDVLQDPITRFCALVQREAFTMGLISLGLLRPTSQTIPTTSDTNQDGKENPSLKNQVKPHAYKLSLVEALMKPPLLHQSNLSKAAINLFKSERFVDMIFEVPVLQTTGGMSRQSSDYHLSALVQNIAETTKSNSRPSNSESFSFDRSSIKAQENSANPVIIKAHRVIVAARCEWFKRALQSGMKEAIQRKIVVHDTSPIYFLKLLNFIYTGKIDVTTGSTDQLTEILVLSDKYQLDSLKQSCDKTLSVRHLEKDNACFLLCLADQYNAPLLRESCIEFMAILSSPLRDFDKLPVNLQTEVCTMPIASPIRRQKLQAKKVLSPPTNTSWLGMDLLYDAINNADDDSDCSSIEENTVNRSQLNDCLAHLRDVLGPEVSLEQLNRIALAADCDPNRALNFYYSSNNASNEGGD